MTDPTNVTPLLHAVAAWSRVRMFGTCLAGSIGHGAGPFDGRVINQGLVWDVNDCVPRVT